MCFILIRVEIETSESATGEWESMTILERPWRFVYTDGCDQPVFCKPAATPETVQRIR